MALNAEQFGRIIYVEPTNIIGNKAVENEDLINHPYEDYCIAVDLTVKIANRYSCGSAAKNGLMETLSWSTDKGNISFMRGTGQDGDLTISYTDVRPSNPVDQDTRECLGIKAIHIQYNSWMYPEVTIEFVDVMGASVLAKEEYNSNRAKDDVVSPNRSLYHALFSFPYPMFILKVKGFYGQGVTYKLAIKKTKMDFDANTGNFNITAEFIGYMYGLYTDMPMTLISVAPYTEFGKKYWETQVANGSFKYHEKDGTEGCGMMTFPEFRYKVAAVAASEEYNSIAKGMDSNMANIQSQKDELNDIKKLIPLSKTLINDAKCIKSSSGRYIRISSKNEVLTEEDFEEKLKAFNEAVNQYTENHGSQDNIINIKSNGKTELKEKDGSIKRQTKVENVVCTKTTTTQNGKSVTDWEILGENVTDEEAAEIKKLLVDNGNTPPVNVSLISLGKNDSEYLDVEGKINSVLETLDNRMNSLKSEAEERQNTLIEKALGFRPSIKNIFDMAFAHMETFIQGMGEVLGKIEKGDNQRRKVTKNDDTDVNEETLAPPFFKMFKEKVDSQGNKTNDEVYFDRFERFNGQELEEDVYVKSLLEGAQLYCERMVDVESTISALSNQSGATKIVASDAPTLSCKNFIPITVYDMVNKDKMANPYKHIKKLCEKNQDIRLATFAAAALRGYYYLCTNPNVKDRWFKDDDIKLMGKVEAINFYKGVGKKVNSKFMDFLNTYADGWWDSSEANSIISDLCTTSSNGYKSLWSPNTVDFGDSLFKRTADGNIVLNMQAGENSYLPIGVTDFNEIVTDYTSHNLKNFESYIPTKNYQISQKDFEEGNLGVLDEKTTFHMYEDRDYIKNLYNTIEMELQGAVGTGNKAILDGKVDDVMKVYRGYVRETLSGCTLFSNKDTNIFNSGEGGFINKLEQKGESINWENEEESKCDIEEIDGDDLKDLIANGTLQDWNSVYVKYPGIYNEDFDKPIFFHDVYTSQTSLEAKAYIFIFSTPIIIDKDDKDWGQNADGGNGGIPNRVQNGATFKLRLLREGAAYWRENQYKANKNSDPINFGNLTNTPKIREVPIAKYGTQKWTEFQTIKLAQNQSYDKWEEPRGTTPSRKSTLIKYFKSWVNSEFTTINNLATKEELYGNETTTNNGNGKSSRGLNGVYVYTTRRTDLTIQYAKQLQEALRKTFLSPCITLDYYTGVLTNRDGFNGCSYKELKEFLKGFMKGLQDLYGTLVKKYKDDKAGVVSEITAAEANDPYKSYDIKLSLYQTLCNLYNKWLCSPEERGLNAWKLSNTDEDNGSDFANFIYIDTFYNDKGYDILVNATKVSEWISNCLPSTNLSTNEGLMNYMGRTIYQFLQDVTQSTGGILLALPQKLGVKDNESLVKMFNTYNYNADGWNDDKTTFVYFYSYKPSEHLGDNKNGSINGYPSDGFDINRPEEIIGSLAEPRSDGRSIPAFGVTFGKQNQSLFKAVTLNTDTRSVTEASIAATFNIASQAADGPRESNLYGQDLYRVYSQYAYNADVEMMGNAQIMPLMYFELNNIPLWKGAYVIQKVTHDIVPGNMTTKFTGVRINRNTIPITDGTKINCIKEIEDDDSDTGLTGTKATSTNFNPTVNENGQEVTNVTDTKGNIIGQVVTPDSNTAANSNITLTDTIDFNEANVTKNKPIICVTPAHGPRTEKRQEWIWSTKMIDNYLIPMLKQCKYSDGTSFNVQRCNKNGNHTSDGYSMTETYSLVKKYGSECVISVVPHWNGGHGQYHGVFVNKASNGVRSDAKKFAECMLASVKVTAGKRDSYSSLPEGAMDGIKSTKIYNLGKDRDDGAVYANCACILTENWFADYPYGCKWSDDKEYADKDDDGRYTTFRGWLMSDEGCRAIAEMHVRGIQNYINTLKG